MRAARKRVVMSVLAYVALHAIVACDRGATGDGEAGDGSMAVNAGPYADKVRETIPQIEKATGLKFKTPP